MKPPLFLTRWMLCAAALLTSTTHGLEIIAHRGASFDAPENTITAFRLGWAQGADAVELDVWLSSDQRLVCSHDENLKRTAGKDLKVSAVPAASLKSVEVGAWKHPAWRGEPIPLLEEVLPLIPPGRHLLIEVKCGPEAIPHLKRLIEASGRTGADLSVISFNFDVCAGMKKAMPSVPVMFLAAFGQDKTTQAWRPEPAELIARAKAAGLDALNLNYKGPWNKTFVQQVHDAGLKCYVWTINDAAIAERMARDGVDGITSDRPGWLREQLTRAGVLPAPGTAGSTAR